MSATSGTSRKGQAVATLYLRMPADDDTDDFSDDNISAILDDDSTTAWISSQPMTTPGQAFIIDRGDSQGDGRFESMIDGDPASKWSTTLNITPGQAVIIDRGDPVKGIGDPASMLDNDASSRWTSGINMKPGMAVVIDRGETNLYLFNQLVMDSGTDANGYARSYTVSVSDDNHTWTQVTSGTIPDVVASPVISTAVFSLQLSRYVKITQTGTASHPWSLTSVRLRYIRDGVGRTLVVSSNWAISISGIVATLPVFNRVVMNSGTGSNNYARAFDIAVSTDKTTWTTVASGAGASPIIAIAFADQFARYVKIIQTVAASNVWTLTDIDLSEGGVSLDRSAWEADVEGNVGPLPTFDQIVMDSGSTNSNSYARRFDVYVSSNGTTWTKVNTGVGASAIVASARFAPQTTRYFKIVQNGTAPEYWALVSLTALNVGAVLDRGSWEASVSTPEPLHGADYWLPLSVNGEGPIPPDPMHTMDDSLTTWYTSNFPVVSGHPLVIDRGTDTAAFSNIVVYFGALLSGQIGWDSVNAKPTTRFQILVSSDKVTWTWVATAYVSGQALAVLLDQPQTARYIQLVLMEGLTQPWTVTSISLFDGDTPLSRTGWTVTTAEVRSGSGGFDRSLLRLYLPGTGTRIWVSHLPPTATLARPLALKMRDKSWKTVMSLGARTIADAPSFSSFGRRITINDLTGVRHDDVDVISPADGDLPSVHPGFTQGDLNQYLSTARYLSAFAINYSEWRREPVNGQPIGDQVRYYSEHDYYLTTIWFTQMDRVRQYWSGFPVKKLRFGFQIQNYDWDVYHPDDNPKPPSPGTFLLYREPSVPPLGVPPTSVTGTPIHTFNPVHDWPASVPSGAAPELHRGEMFWYEIDPAWRDVAFTLCTMWQAIDLEPPISDPGTGATPLPDVADGFYEYRTLESVYVKVVFQVVLDEG